MGAVAEGDVWVRITRDIELLGIGELPRVAIRRADHGEYDCARGNCLPAQVGRLGGCPEPPMAGRAVAQHLLDGGRNERLWELSQPGECAGVLAERDDRVVQQVRGGLAACK